MDSILFIHGFCSEINSPVFHINTLAGSEINIFREGRSHVHIFPWAISKTLSFWQTLNPLSYVHLYKAEFKKSQSKETLQALHGEIKRTRPSIIVAHSMGCALWLAYIKLYPISKTVKRIIFIQADIPTVLDNSIEEHLERAHISIENFHCPWDQALLTSIVANRSCRAGLTGIKSKVVTNRLYPLLKLWNLHTAGLRSLSFYTDVCKLQ